VLLHHHALESIPAVTRHHHLQASKFAGVRSALAALSAPAAGGQGQGPPPSPGDSWRSEVGLHMGILSEWLWGARMPGYPLEQGRFIEVGCNIS
jgi:hypothetical protein